MGLLTALGLPPLPVANQGPPVARSRANAKLPAKAPAKAPASRSAGSATLVVDAFVFAKSDVPGAHLGAIEDLRRRLQAAPASTVRLVGHTDTVGTERNNLKLGLQRAAAVRALLIGPQGIAEGHVKVETAGETQPAAGEPPAKPDPARGEKNARNRRVEVFVAWVKPQPVPPPVKDPDPSKPEPTKRPKGAVADPGEHGGRLGTTFEHQWESSEFGNWRASYVKGSFKLKAKIKGELIQKGSGEKVTGGYTTNKGMKLLMELGKQHVVKILDGLTLKDLTETFEHEFSAKKVELKFQVKATIATSVPWLVLVVAGSFVLVGVDWKKLSKDQGDFQVATFVVSGGAQGKGTIDLGKGWDANLGIELTVEGSAGPNWPAIIANVAEKVLIDVAEAGAAAEAGGAAAEGAAESGAAAAVTFDTVIAAGAVALGASVILGTLKSMIDGEEIRQLSKTVDKTTRAFRRGFTDGILLKSEPSDPLAKAGFQIGRQNFEQAARAARAKYPLTDNEIRKVLQNEVRANWDRLYWTFHPHAQQAVWDAFGASHVGFVNRNIDSTTVRWGYVAIYGRSPDEGDANYQKYYRK